jgi:uncharacterized membrane protein
MRLLKIIFVIFLIYFIRRFIQMYKVMKRVQAEQELIRRRQYEQQQYQANQTPPKKHDNVINADFKILD